MQTKIGQDTLPEPKIDSRPSSERSINQIPLVSPSSSQLSRAALKPPDTHVLNVPDQAENQAQAYLQIPSNEAQIKSSSTSTVKSALKPSQASLDVAVPLKQPTVTPETLANVVFGVHDRIKVPLGVVPMPEEKKGNANELLEVEDNRYKNVKESDFVDQMAGKVGE